MNTFENTYKEPVLIIRNNYDIHEDNDSLELIANNLNQNLKVFRNKNLIREIITSNNCESIEFSFHNYEISKEVQKILVHGKEAFLFYDGFVFIHLPFDIDYDTLFKMHNEDKLVTDSYFNSLFQKIKKLGSNEIHITVFHPKNIKILVKDNWSVIEQILQTKEEYFKIVL
jgi:hypothetical protein